MIKKLISEINIWLVALLRNIPGSLGWRIRSIFYKNKFKGIGKKVSFSGNCYIKGPSNITLGDNIGFGIFTQLYCDDEYGDSRVVIGSNCNFNSNVMINADHGGIIEIGNNVIVGPNVVIRASNHKFDTPEEPIKKQGHDSGSIIILDNVWIGANVVLLPNITIGSGCVIAAGSVVNKSISEKTIAAGVPAKVIKSR